MEQNDDTLKIKVSTLDTFCSIVKKYGIGLVLFGFFLYQYLSLNGERVATQKALEDITRQTVVVLVKMEERLDNLEKLSNSQQDESKELRYEVRLLSNKILGNEKRFINE